MGSLATTGCLHGSPVAAAGRSRRGRYRRYHGPPRRRRPDGCSTRPRCPVTILRLSLALLLNQIGFHAYTATLPLALSRAGHADATIGLVMGVAAIVQIPAAIAGGRLLDRFGPARLFTTGGLAFISASAI